MKTLVGIWIDHKQAVLVIHSDKDDSLKKVVSGLEKRIRYSGASHTSDPTEPYSDTAEDKRDRRYNTGLDHYYNEVIATLPEDASLLLMGPGEAKHELQKHLIAQGLGEQIASIKTVDKMTENQIAAEVREHFRALEHHR